MAKKKIIDPDVIRELADLLSETDLSEIEVENAGTRVRVARQTGVLMASPGEMPAAIPAGGASAAAPSTGDSGGEVPQGTIRSPMVGTVYRSPEPGAAPFVEIGDRVSEGQTCLIVEAMKTMNHIPSPHAGTVTAILIEDGQPVEYGEPLFAVS